jgi:hypothetical protein
MIELGWSCQVEVRKCLCLCRIVIMQVSPYPRTPETESRPRPSSGCVTHTHADRQVEMERSVNPPAAHVPASCSRSVMLLLNDVMRTIWPILPLDRRVMRHQIIKSGVSVGLDQRSSFERVGRRSMRSLC